jgi:hypothetical protein
VKTAQNNQIQKTGKKPLKSSILQNNKNTQKQGKTPDTIPVVPTTNMKKP